MRRNYLIYLILLTSCFSLGLLTLLFGYKNKVISTVDSFLFTHSIEKLHPSQQLDHYDGVNESRNLLVKNNSDLPKKTPISVIELDLDESEIIFNNPPLASDIAVILDQVRKRGGKNIYLTTQFHQSVPEGEMKHLIQQVLSKKIEGKTIENFVIPIQCTFTPKNTPPPTYLNSSLIELNQVSGNKQLIPKVNNIIHTPIDKINFSSSVEVPESVSFGFSKIDSVEPLENKQYLIARWDNKILLHHSLFSLIKLYNISISEIKINLGKEIYFGHSKPSIPIDQFGCVTENYLSQTNTRDFIHINADLIADEIEPITLETNVIVKAKSKEKNDYQVINNPEKFFNSLSKVPPYHVLAYYFRLPLWLEAFILIELTLIAAYIYKLKPINRHLAYILLLIIVFITFQILSKILGYWYPYSSAIILIIAAWVITTLISSKLRMRRKNHTFSKSHREVLSKHLES